jgi:hypothetical protein
MAVREVWENGVLVTSEDIPDPEPEPPTAEERIAQLEAIIAALIEETP